MSKRFGRQRRFALNWLGVVLIVAGALSWLPAAAQDGTPEDVAPPVIATAAPPEPEVVEPTPAPPTSAPAEPPPAAAPTDMPEGDAPAALERLTIQAAPQVTSIALTCAMAGATIDGAAVVVDADVSTITLRLMTTDVPALGPLQEIDLALSAGQGAYAFEAELESNDVATSITKRVVVVGPNGGPMSNEIPVVQGGDGATSCVPVGSVSPTQPTTTTSPSPTASLTATATGTAAPTTAVGRVSNTGAANLNCRAQANTSAAILARIPAGSTVQVRGAASGGWVPVRCNNQDGWVSAEFLVVTTAPATPAATATVPPAGTPTTTPAPGTTTFGTVSSTGGSNLRCRTTPNTSGAIITLLPAGSRVETRGAAVNGWLPVRCGGQDGWVSASYLTLSTGPATPTPTATSPATVTTTPVPGGGTSVATVSGTGGAGLRCRTAAISGAVITVLPEMSRVETIGAQQNGWIQARCGGQLGWVSVTYLTFNVGTGSGSGEIWMDIDLGDQYMVVYQGDKAIARTYVSTGRPGFDTPTGTYYINRKVPVKDMTGTLGGEYYYVHDVPSVMYFTNRGHAIHGAYWHNNFGYRMSHGCVNLPVGFAKWLYSVTPMGARVRIHY